MSGIEGPKKALDEASRTRIRSATITKMDISGDTASVTTTAPGPERHIELVKIVHGWKIHQPSPGLVLGQRRETVASGTTDVLPSRSHCTVAVPARGSTAFTRPISP